MAARRFARKAIPLTFGAVFFVGGIGIGAIQAMEKEKGGRGGCPMDISKWALLCNTCMDEANRKKISFVNNFLSVINCAEMPKAGLGRAETIGTDYFEKEVFPKIYEDLPQEYDDLGQVERNEVHITVQEHVFAQMGIITYEGIKRMIKEFNIIKGDVFCDLGSGTGNVCMQVMVDSTCSSVTGVEIIPSRNRFAEYAFVSGKKHFPKIFTEESHAAFHLGDVATCSTFLNKEQVSVLFTHSWMFDDDLMVKLSRELEKVPSLRAVITSRPLVDLDASKTKLEFCCKTTFQADWNEKSPFYVYTRKE